MTSEFKAFHDWQDEKPKRIAEMLRLQAVNDQLGASNVTAHEMIEGLCAALAQSRAETETARSIGASPTARFVSEARELHLCRDWPANDDVETMATTTRAHRGWDQPRFDRLRAKGC